MGQGGVRKFGEKLGGKCLSRPFLRALSRLRGNETASSTIEFAILGVPFLAVLMSVLETGIVLWFSSSLDHTTQRIARLIKTGQVQAANIQSEADFRSRLLCPASGGGILPGYFACGRLIIDVRIAPGPGGADLSRDFYNNPAARQFCLGSAGSLIVVRVGYAFPAILPILAILANGSIVQSRAGLVDDVPEAPGWNHLLFSTAIFQNEAVVGATTAGCGS